jgi:hypothetical protein
MVPLCIASWRVCRSLSVLSLDLDSPHCALIVCLELQFQSFHCSYDFRRLGCEGGGLIIVVADSTFKIRPALKDFRSAREIARKGVSKFQIRYIYLDDANPVILFPARNDQEYFLYIMRRLERDHGANFWSRNRVPEKSKYTIVVV